MSAKRQYEDPIYTVARAAPGAGFAELGRPGVKMLAVRFHADEFQELRELAERDGVSVAAAVRLAVGLGLKTIASSGQAA